MDDSEAVGPVSKRSKDDVTGLASWLVENSWVILDYERHLHETRAASAAKLKPLSRDMTELDVFNLHVPEAVWARLCKVINRNIVIDRSEECSDTQRRDTTCDEVRHWYAMQMALENTYGNSNKSLPAHIKAVKQHYGRVPRLGVGRFQILSAACCPTVKDLKKLAALLDLAAKEQLTEVHVVTIDESVIGYAPSNAVKDRMEKAGTPAPVVFIQRKPHPNGLECFVASTYVIDPGTRKSVPYVCALAPHLEISDFTNTEVVEKIVREWPAALGHPHYVVDAGFGHESLAVTIASNGGQMTASMSSHRLGVLWRALSCSLPSGNWRAAVNTKSGLVASVHCSTDGAGQRTYQHVLSTNWTMQASPQQPEPGTPVVVEAAAAAAPSGGSIIPQYTRETLNGFALATLKDICRAHNIRPVANRKSDYIDSILERVAVVHRHFSEVEKTCHLLRTHWIKGNGPLHDFYGEHFNLVDLVDRAWNSVEEHHHYRDWKCKYLRFLLRFAVYNAMVHSQQNRGQTWLQFREAVVHQIITI